jgi:2,3-dihydroxybiphenyl 1,2-dioxygenase
MNLQALGYVGIRTRKLEDWNAYASRFLGLQLVDESRTTLAFRMDDRKQRIVVEQSETDAPAFYGWEVENAAALDALAAHLEKNRVKFARGARALADERRVKDLIVLADPIGNRVEVFHGAEVASEPFRPGRAISGFRTGALGMGHAVLTAERLDEVLPFYQDILGFKASDYILKPFAAYFFHINPRHHSLAFIETGKNAVHHMMMELYSFDDVGQGYDIAQGENRVATTLGRHTSDFITSFYSWTPSNFMVEYGWGARDIDVQNWKAYERKEGPSMWGHDRTWLSKDDQDKARALRLANAEKGFRQPVQVLDGNYNRMPGVCPWWDQMKAQKTG